MRPVGHVISSKNHEKKKKMNFVKRWQVNDKFLLKMQKMKNFDKRLQKNLANFIKKNCQKPADFVRKPRKKPKFH